VQRVATSAHRSNGSSHCASQSSFRSGSQGASPRSCPKVAPVPRRRPTYPPHQFRTTGSRGVRHERQPPAWDTLGRLSGRRWGRVNLRLFILAGFTGRADAFQAARPENSTIRNAFGAVERRAGLRRSSPGSSAVGQSGHNKKHVAHDSLPSAHAAAGRASARARHAILHIAAARRAQSVKR